MPLLQKKFFIINERSVYKMYYFVKVLLLCKPLKIRD